MAKVLLVDDEELVRRIVRTVLEAEGHEVQEASTGSDAVSKASTNPPDAVVLDLMIPGDDGFEVCRRLKAEHAEAKVLVLSAVPVADSEDRARGAGADDVMEKPFSALDLLGRLSALMENR